MSGIPAFDLPVGLAKSWQFPMIDAGCTVLDVGKAETRNGIKIVNYGGVIRHNDVQIFLTIYPIIKGDRETFYATIYPIGMSQKRQKLSHIISQVLIASGAKSWGANYGFKEIFKATYQTMEKILNSYHEKIIIKQIDNDNYVNLRQFNVEKVIDIMCGYGWDSNEQKNIPYIAIDYRKPLFGITHDMAKIIENIITNLNAAGAERLETVLPWPIT